MTDSISLKLAVYCLQCRIFVCLEEKKIFWHGSNTLNSQAGKSLRVNKSRNFFWDFNNFFIRPKNFLFI